MTDMRILVDGIWTIADYTDKEKQDRQDAIEQEKQDSRRPIPVIPLTEEEQRRRWNRRMNAERREELRNGIDRS